MKAFLSYLQPLNARYNALNARDQRVLIVLALFLGIVLLWGGVWQPLQNMRDNSIDSYKTVSADLAWMQLHASNIKQNAVISTISKSNRPLLTIVTDTALPYQITISHAEPSEDGTLHIAIDNVIFNRLVSWLEQLQHDQHVTVTNAAMQKIDASAGAVNAVLIIRQEN